MKMQRILEYVAIALMVLNIVGYALHKSISCIALFGVGAYIARCFSKNLTINIFAGLLVSNVFFGCSSLREGHDPDDGLEKLKKKLIHLIDGAEAKEDADAASEDKVTGDTSCVVNAEGNKWIKDRSKEEDLYEKKNLTPNDRDKAMIKYSKQIPTECANIKNPSDCAKFGDRVHWCEWKKADAESCVMGEGGKKWINNQKYGSEKKHYTSDIPLQCAKKKTKEECAAGVSEGDGNHDWCEWK